MQKQVSSNTVSSILDPENKFNKVSTFITKFLFQSNFEMLKKSGYVDSFTSDPELEGVVKLDENQRFVFLLFKSKKLKLADLKIIVKSLSKIPIEVVHSYELVNDYCMLVVDFPEKYVEDYDKVVKGSYSGLSEGYKKQFPLTMDLLNSDKRRIGVQYTLYHHIFNKTAWLKQFWLDRLGLADLEDVVELWEQPSEKDLVFNIKEIIKNNK